MGSSLVELNHLWPYYQSIEVPDRRNVVDFPILINLFSDMVVWFLATKLKPYSGESRHMRFVTRFYKCEQRSNANVH